MKQFVKILAIVIVSSLMLITGCSNSVTAKPKSLAESIQGHWKDNGGAEYFISNKKFILKDTDGSVRRFTYLVEVENPDKSMIEIKLKTVEGQLGVTRKIYFKDKNRKSAVVETILEGIDITTPNDTWSYVDGKTSL